MCRIFAWRGWGWGWGLSLSYSSLAIFCYFEQTVCPPPLPASPRLPFQGSVQDFLTGGGGSPCMIRRACTIRLPTCYRGNCSEADTLPLRGGGIPLDIGPAETGQQDGAARQTPQRHRHHQVRPRTPVTRRSGESLG